MSPTVVLVWYLVVAGPQGGLAILPSYFDKREDCVSAITEYQKQPVLPGWSVQCVPSASPFADEGVDEGAPTEEQPAP
jgi:hypothetical protein